MALNKVDELVLVGNSLYSSGKYATKTILIRKKNR